MSETSHSCTVSEGMEVVTDWSGIGKVERSCNPSTPGMHVDVCESSLTATNTPVWL